MMMNKDALLTKLKNISILIIEDGEEILGLIEYTFKLLVKEIHTAKNGIEGLQQLQTFAPTLIITDIRMPEMNGSKMIEHIRKEHGSIPIIVVTGFKDDLKCPELVDFVFEKPINFAHLLSKIDEIIPS